MMVTLPAELYYAEIEASTATLAALVDSTEPSLPIPTCPDWTLRQLATHLGRAQRWADQIVSARSAEFIEFRAVPDGRLPDDQAARGRWLTTGAARLVGALREAGDDLVWAFGSMLPASFWARRMSHESMVHCADAQLAAGDEVAMTAELAADAIDEWLRVMSGPDLGQPDRRETVLAPGRTLHVHATDTELGGAGEWLVTNSSNGVRVTGGHGSGDVALSGPAADLLLVLLGRKPATAEPVKVFGDNDLLDAWLSGIPF
jgi:uncharacterized protein (TIGR03083 family)